MINRKLHGNLAKKHGDLLLSSVTGGLFLFSLELLCLSW